MEISRQIKEICQETKNTWFLTHNITKVALYDLEYPTQEPKRTQNIAKILNNVKGIVFNYESEEYRDDHIWILPESINGEIPGFILLRKTDFEDFEYELYFALVRKKYRKKCILKKMFKENENIGDIWLEAESNEIDNVEIIWEKFGFTFHKEITTNTPYYSEHKIYGRRIYKKLQHNK